MCADFDGDTLAIQLVPEEQAEDTYKKLSPRYVTFYHKNGQPIPTINHETLNGLAVATEWTPEDPKDLKEPRYFYDNYAQLLKDVEVDKIINVGTPITFTGKVGDVEYKGETTTYGRIRLSKILGKNINDLDFSKDKFTRIDAKGAVKLSAYLCDDKKTGIEKRQQIQKFCLKVVTLAGVVTFDYKTLFTDCMNNDKYKELCKIADSKDLTDQQKLAILTTKYEEYEKEMENKFSEDLKNELNRAGRVKLSSISALNMPQFIVSGVDEKPIITRGNLLEGYNEKDMITHTLENRALLTIKQSGTPASGYLNRQISFVLNHYVYKEGEDPENPGIMIPRYRAVGRVGLNGKRYSAVSTKDETDLVPVRSIISKNKETNIVTTDLISTKLNDYTDGAAIGLSLGTGFMEASTQGVMALKHGGHERVLDMETYLRAPKKCTFREEGKWIYLKTGTKELKYPRPSNIVTLGKSEFEEGETVCCAYNTVSPINKLRKLTQLISARTSSGTRYYEKDNILVSECFAYNDGEIHYEENEKGKITVVIGTDTYTYNPNCMYFYPEGTKIKKFTKFCSGVVDMSVVCNTLKTNLNDIYQIFRKQYYTVYSKNYVNKGYVSDDEMPEEAVEIVFSGLYNIKYNSKDLSIAEIKKTSVNDAILNSDSFFSALSFGNATKTVKRAIKGEVDVNEDLITGTVLGLLLTNKLDEDNN